MNLKKLTKKVPFYRHYKVFFFIQLSNSRVITMDENSTIAKMAKVVVVLPGVSPKLKNKGISITSTQPMGSAFEQMMFLTYDGIIMELMDRMGQTSDEMFLRHADFE